MHIEPVQLKDINLFHNIVLSYWQETMPQAAVVTDPEKRDIYFRSRFSWHNGSSVPYWAMDGTRHIGFVMFDVNTVQSIAVIHDFYVIPSARRRGHGAEMVQVVLRYFDSLDIEQIDLNVRRDNPHALNFWQNQGFGIAGYRLRQYRDPKTGETMEGALSSDV